MSEIADIYAEGDPFIAWNEANDANADGEAVMAAERQTESADAAAGAPPDPDENTAQCQADAAEWTPDDAEEARREGWEIRFTDDPDDGPWQLQRVDDPGELAGTITATVGRLWDEDNQAWMHVWGVKSDLHRRALAYLRAMSTPEWKAIENWAAGHGYPPSPNLG
jgi:hypothetical protein